MRSTDSTTVWMLRGLPGGEFDLQPIKMGMLRVSDAVPFDYNEDGLMDVIVGDFGS